MVYFKVLCLSLFMSSKSFLIIANSLGSVYKFSLLLLFELFFIVLFIERCPLGAGVSWSWFLLKEIRYCLLGSIDSLILFMHNPFLNYSGYGLMLSFCWLFIVAKLRIIPFSSWEAIRNRFLLLSSPRMFKEDPLCYLSSPASSTSARLLQ